MFEKFEILVAMLAAFVVVVTSLILEISLEEMAVRMISTIVVFYVLGLFLKLFIFSAKEVNEPKENDLKAGKDDLVGNSGNQVEIDKAIKKETEKATKEVTEEATKEISEDKEKEIVEID